MMAGGEGLAFGNVVLSGALTQCLQAADVDMQGMYALRPGSGNVMNHYTCHLARSTTRFTAEGCASDARQSFRSCSPLMLHPIAFCLQAESALDCSECIAVMLLAATSQIQLR